MSRFRLIKNSFLGGQISRTCVGRTDLPTYPHSCEILQNMIPLLSGGAGRRPGTLSQASLPAYNSSTLTTGDRPPRLIPFIVSRNEAYVLQLGYKNSAGYIQVYRATGNSTGQLNTEVASFSTPYLPNTSTPNSLGNFDDDWWAVQYAQSNDVMWLTHPNYNPIVIQRTAIDTFSILFFYDSLVVGTRKFSESQAFPYLNQNATTHTMAVSATTGNATLTCSAPYFTAKHPGSIIAIQSGTLTGSGGALAFAKIVTVGTLTGGLATTANVTIDGTMADTSAHTTWWESAWSDYRGWPRSVCIYQQRLCFGGTVPVGGETVDAFGIPVGQPDTIWFSETGSPSKFSALGDSATAGVTGTLATGQNYATPGNFVYYPVDDSQGDGQSTGPVGIQPFRVTLADSQLDAIQWMSPDQQILIGTLAEEWIIAPVNGSFDVANSLATIQSHYGSDFVPAVRIGYELMFAMRSQCEVRAYQYNYFDQSFFGEPVQLMFDEYPMAEVGTLSAGRRKFRQMDWDVTRNTLWCVDTQGNFFGMTRDRKLQVTMWHTHQFGGFNPAEGVRTGAGTMADPAWAVCDGSVISFASIPNPVGGYNDIWLVVKRTVAGAVQWQIERMIGANTVRQSAYSSCFPGQSGTEPYLVDAATVFTEADWDTTDNQYTVGTQFNGYTLTGTYYSSIYGLFQTLTTGPVVSGVATLNPNLPPDYATNPTYVFTLGLPYTPIIQPVRIDPQGQIGTTQGAIKRISKAYLWLYKTLGLNCGSPPNGQTESPSVAVPFLPGTNLSQSPEVYTGEKQVFVPQQFDRSSYLYITQNQPFPLFIASIISEGESYEQ